MRTVKTLIRLGGQVILLVLSCCSSIMICKLFYNTLPHNLVEDKLLDLFEQIFARKRSLYLAYNDKNVLHFWITQKIQIVVKQFVTRSPVFWTIFFAIQYTKIVFRWGRTALLLLQICFCFYDVSLCLRKIRLILLKRSHIQLLDTLTIYLILIMFILNTWWTRYIQKNYSF